MSKIEKLQTNMVCVREHLRQDGTNTAGEDQKCILKLVIVQTYSCERDTFRLSFCLLCISDRDPLEAVRGSARKTVY